jgi:hypothetical protein
MIQVIAYPVLLFFLFLFNHADGQILQIGDVNETKKKINSLIVEDSSSFYRVSSLYKNKGTLFFIQRFQDLQQVYEGEIQTRLGDKTLGVMRVEMLNGHITAFLVAQENDRVDFLVQQYDTLCTPISEPRIFWTFPLVTSQNIDQYSIEISPKKQFVAIVLNYRDKETGADYLSYALFGDDMTMIYRDNLPSERNNNNSSFSSWWLNEQGSLLVSENVLIPKAILEKKSSRQMEYVNMHILEKGMRSQFRLIGPPNTYLSQLVCSLQENGRVEGTGIYCADNDHFRGVFCFTRSDPSQVEVIANTWDRKSNPELATFDLGISRRKKTNKERIRIYACNESEVLGTFSSNNSRFVVWERQYSIYNKSSVTYATRDILILKITDNQLNTAVVVPKIQYSYNSDETNISTFLTVDSNKLILFFNDDAKNYDPSGKFNESIIEPVKLTRLAEVNLIQVKYDLETSKLERQVVFNETIFDLIGAPKYWIASGRNNEFLLYFYFKNKERFAYWQL